MQGVGIGVVMRRRLLNEKSVVRYQPDKENKRALPVMLQGTMSNAGKSLLCTALCRIFAQDGYRVAPFKSQNMALNSFITSDGLEMGRAQAVQAEAAGKKASADMNPILLKPTSDTASQVIVNGRVLGSMKASEYFEYKKKLIPDIMAAYERLALQNDIIVIEGAGSPAEINLKDNDIVNMGLAALVKAPVLLVGDIDRGGVFAQLYGTVKLLDADERARIKAFIINKFRGDASILKSGITQLEQLMELPCAGVIPYSDVDIDDEDSLSPRLAGGVVKDIDIAVIRLPRISNFTDFSVFESIRNVSVRYVSCVKELGKPDIIIIPGTKNTISDMLWMRENGLEAAVKKHASDNKIIIGICGGLQILGISIADEEGSEDASGGHIMGMGLLPVVTIFRDKKVTRQVEGIADGLTGRYSPLNGSRYSGYEIHMGESRLQADGIRENNECNTNEKRLIDKALVQRDNVLASYIHGIFDEELGRGLVRLVCAEKHIPFDDEGMPRKDYKEQQYDKLADIVRKSLDMDMIYGIIGVGMGE